MSKPKIELQDMEEIRSDRRECVGDFAEWLNTGYPNFLGTVIVFQDRKALDCDAVETTKRSPLVGQREGLCGLFAIDSPTRIWIAAQYDLVQIIYAIAHEWRHGLQYIGLSPVSPLDDNSAIEGDAKRWALETIDEYIGQAPKRLLRVILNDPREPESGDGENSAVIRRLVNDIEEGGLPQ